MTTYSKIVKVFVTSLTPLTQEQANEWVRQLTSTGEETLPGMGQLNPHDGIEDRKTAHRLIGSIDVVVASGEKFEDLPGQVK